jgi:hypothetical protein
MHIPNSILETTLDKPFPLRTFEKRKNGGVVEGHGFAFLILFILHKSPTLYNLTVFIFISFVISRAKYYYHT